MSRSSRSDFLKTASISTAAVGTLGTLATLADLPAVQAAITEPLLSGTSITAHVRNLTTGEIVIWSGAREVVLHDTALAHRLMRAVRS